MIQIEEEIEYYHQVIDHLDDYNQHLQEEFKIIFDIKKKYQEDNERIKRQNESVFRQYNRLQGKYRKLSKEIQLKIA